MMNTGTRGKLAGAPVFGTGVRGSGTRAPVNLPRAPVSEPGAPGKNTGAPGSKTRVPGEITRAPRSKTGARVSGTGASRFSTGRCATARRPADRPRAHPRITNVRRRYRSRLRRIDRALREAEHSPPELKNSAEAGTHLRQTGGFFCARATPGANSIAVALRREGAAIQHPQGKSCPAVASAVS